MQSLMEFSEKREGKFNCDPLVMEILERLVEGARGGGEDLAVRTQAFAKIFGKMN